MSSECLKIQVRGVVQGVGFRPFIYRLADRCDICGTVCNLGNMVEIIACGDRASLDAFLEGISSENPPLSRVDDVSVTKISPAQSFSGFSVIESRRGEAGNSIIPPDMAMCQDCLSEMSDPENRHFDYPFTVCTNCGPRYTIASSLPYDRDNTSMIDFPLCSVCGRSYSDPGDRRYHAQPVCCPHCGPEHSLWALSGSGEPVLLKSGPDSLDMAASLILSGKILALKGYGGFHLVCDATCGRSVRELRKRLGRPDQPFSLMVRDIEAAGSIAVIGRTERRLLMNQRRPIVVCDKITGDEQTESGGSCYVTDRIISPDVSPLHNIGMMLPYSGTHHLLFGRLRRLVSERSGNLFSDEGSSGDGPVQKEDCAGTFLVMTSANMPGLPMVKENDEAFRALREVADYWLTDNRRILNRADDTVIRTVNGSQMFLRRSRGYVPERIRMPFSCPRKIAAVGAEMNNTVSMSSDDFVYLSQYIGNTKHVATSDYHRETLQALSRLSGISPDVMACDLHPGFNTTKTAEAMAADGLFGDPVSGCVGSGSIDPVSSASGKTAGLPLFRIQHHHAHICSVMGDNMLPSDAEVIGLALDGVGYGTDGTVWGGEIMKCSYAGYERLGSLKSRPMPGADLAAYYPARMIFGMLYDYVLSGEMDESDLSSIPGLEFRHGEEEKAAVLFQLKNNMNIAYTSSAGRFLDAVSALLGICPKRTYEGGPAMALESAAVAGRRLRERMPVAERHGSGSFEPVITEKNGMIVFDTGRLLKDILERSREGKDDPRLKYLLADAAQDAFARGISDAAVRICRKTGIEIAALSGGVCNNDYIVRTIAACLRSEDILPLTPKNLPAGDGCISHGQVLAAAAQLSDRK